MTLLSIKVVETAMTSDVFERITQPCNLKMFDQVGITENKKMKHAVSEAENHVIACSLRSKGIARVERYTEEFMKMYLV